MKKKIVLVGETDIYDGVDLIHKWSSVKQALKSGRFDYLEDSWDEDCCSMEELSEIETVEILIKEVGHPFYLVDKNNLVTS